MNTSPRHKPVLNPPLQQSAITTQGRSYSSSQQQIQPSFSRQASDISFYDQNSSQSDNTQQPWTRKQWEALELWYCKMDRDYERAAMAFYIHESVVSETSPPLWSKDYILWRSQCLDTNTKYHHGITPSERKKRRKDSKNKLKQDLIKRQHSTPQLESLDFGQGKYRKHGHLTTKATDTP